MKRVSSFFISLILILCTFFCVPLTGEAAIYTPDVEIYSESYMLINLDDSEHQVIVEKDADVRRYPASLTKIVTAMVTLNNVDDLSQQVTVSKSAYESILGTGAQVANLKIGDVLTVEQLLYLTIVHSACDSSQVLAEFVGGTVQNFCNMMNEWVKSIGCTDTNFVNPDGLHNDNHYTTARDMSIITLEALKNETFVKICDTFEYEYNGEKFYHTNMMMNKYRTSYFYKYAKGIKTGSTKEAGYCLVTRASKDGYNYLAIVMGAPRIPIDGILTKCSFIDCKSLFEWAFNSLKYTPIVRQNDIIAELPVKNGKDADSLQLVAKDDITALVPTSLDVSAVIIEPKDMPEIIEAPIAKGDSVCTADIIYGGQVIESVELVAGTSVELSTFLKILNGIKAFITNPFVIAIFVVALLLLLIYFGLYFNNLRKSRRQLEAKRRRREELDDQINQDLLNIRDNDNIPPPKR